MEQNDLKKPGREVTTSPSLWKRFTDCVRFYYFHYTIITTIAMMEPVERYVFNAFVTIFISLFLYTTAAYLPGHLSMMFDFLLHLSGISPYPPEDGELHATSEGFS